MTRAAPASRTERDDGPPVVALRGITKAFPGVLALSEVDLELRAGEVHALTGENGSGKSTLAKVLYGGHRPDAGTVEVDGETVSFDSPRRALERGIVGISQELTLAPTLSVAENIAMGRMPRRRLRTVAWSATRELARAALDQLDVRVDERTTVGDLSVELQQEVEIARALSAESRVLVLDEATSSLSEHAASRLLEMIEALRRRGVAVLIISHRLRELYACAQRATILRDGRRVDVVPLPETPESTLVHKMVGREVKDLFGKRRIERGKPMLAVEGLSASDGSVEDVDLEVCRGEILGVAGLVGSGKSELAHALGGALASTGNVRVAGRPVRLSSPARAAAAGIGHVSDDRKRNGLLPTRSVRHNLSLAWMRRLSRYGVVNPTAERRMAVDAMHRFAIRAPSPETPIAQLSGGNQQKVVLGRWFALEPEVLVLNEPTRGIDVGAKSEIYGFMQTMAENGSAVLMVSSEMPELLGVADRIIVMCRGRVAGEFEAQGTSEEEITSVALDAPPEAGVSSG